MSIEREAISVFGCSDKNGEQFSTSLGADWYEPRAGAYEPVGKVSQITVSRDLPGLHCNMERVCVYVGEHMVWEAPLHALESVTYALPETVTQ
jgi:hypothetical protein